MATATDISKPQLKFHNKIDNTNSPWKPQIKEKPNALMPLAISFDKDKQSFSHPYDFELHHFTQPEEQLKASDPMAPKTPIDDVPLIMVEKEEHIAPLLEDLLKCKTIAIDLEHHSLRSFQGITCLIQISTGDKDYLVDTLSLRSDLHILNQALTDPKILKVFHGADSDILWLQRDLSLYIVNMFDTFHGADVLNLPGKSLVFLLKHYCNVITDKSCQLADWRIRPLPEKLKKYARSDTHYLIWIYEKMRNALLEADKGQTNLLQTVYKRSTETCKRCYNKPQTTGDAYMKLYHQGKKMKMRNTAFNHQQMNGLQHLFNLRDRIAREEDESPGYILSNRMLLKLSAWLPNNTEDILKCCKPVRQVVLLHLPEMHEIILRARKQPHDKIKGARSAFKKKGKGRNDRRGLKRAYHRGFGEGGYQRGCSSGTSRSNYN